MDVNFTKRSHLMWLLLFWVAVTPIAAQKQYLNGLEKLHGVKISQEKGLLSRMKSSEDLSLTPKQQTGFVNYQTLSKWGLKHSLKKAESQSKDSGYEFYGSPYTGMNMPYASIVDENGNTYVTGAASNENSPEGNFVTIKIDADGNQVWEAREPGTKYAAVFGNAITFDNNSNPIATGTYWNGKSMDIQTIKYNAETGEAIWKSTFNGSADGLDVPSFIATDADDNIIVAGLSYVEDGVAYLVLKYDANGNLLWSVADQNMVSETWSEPSAIDVDNNGNIVITGYSSDTNYYQHYYTIKYNAQGELVWKDLYNNDGSTSANSVASDVCFDNDGNCYVTGTFEKNMTDKMGIIKYSPSGEVLWVHTYKSDTDITNATDVKFFGSGIYVAGYHYGSWSNDGMILLSLDEDGNTNWTQETNDLTQITTTHLVLSKNNQPVIAGTGYDDNLSDTRTDVLQYDASGTVVKSTSYLKPYSATSSLMGFVDFGMDMADNIYLLLNVSYTELGNVYETRKLSFDSNESLWENLFSNNGGSNIQLLNTITDQANNLYATSQYGTIENDVYITNNTLTKYNTQGVIEWSKVFNPNNGNASEGIAVHCNNNGDIIVYLVPSSYDGDPIRIKKYDAAGTLIWEFEKQLDTPNLRTFLIDDENNIYIAGSSFENFTDSHAIFTIIKIADNGEELWTSFKDSDNPDDNTFNINGGAVNKNGELIFTGAMGSGGFFEQNIHLFAMKYTPSGDCSWITPVEQTGFNTSGTNLLIDDTNHIYINGFNQDKATYEENMLVSKLDDDGTQLWTSEYHETDRKIRSYEIQQFSDQHIVISGYSVMFEDNRVVLVNFDADGNQDWTYSSDELRFYKDMYLDGADHLFVYNQVQISNLTDRIYYGNGLIPLAGLTTIDANGTANEELLFGPELSMFMPNCMAPLNNGKILLAGEVAHEMNFFKGIYFFESSHIPTGLEEIEKEQHGDISSWLGQNYPNPANTNITTIPFYLPNNGNIDLSIYNLQGEVVYSASSMFFLKGNNVIPVNVSKLKQGSYIYNIKTEHSNSSKIMMVK